MKHPGATRGILGLLLAAGCAGLGTCSSPSLSSSNPTRSATTPRGSEIDPGDYASLDSRRAYWERQVELATESERPRLRREFAEVLLEAGESTEARIHLRMAEAQLHHGEELGRIQRAIGLSWWMDGQPDMAAQYFARARMHVPTHEMRECELLEDSARGQSGWPPSDPLLLVRLNPFLSYLESPTETVSAAPKLAGADRGAAVDVPRSNWGARRVRANVEPMGKITRLTIHHSAHALHASSFEATCSEVRRLQAYHQDAPERLYADLAYHYLIDRAGRVIEGRPLKYRGAHAFRSNNIGNIGVCLLGNFVAGEGEELQRPTAAQWQRLESLVRELRQRYDIPASRLYTHEYFRQTACPGPALAEWVRGQGGTIGKTRWNSRAYSR